VKLIAETIRAVVPRGNGSMTACIDDKGDLHTLCLSNAAERALVQALFASPPAPRTERLDLLIEPTRAGVLRVAHATGGLSFLLGDQIAVHVPLHPQALADVKKALETLGGENAATH
jgi:hypothetical protein